MYLGNLLGPSTDYFAGGGSLIYRNVGTEVRHCRDYEDRNMSKLLDVMCLDSSCH